MMKRHAFTLIELLVSVGLLTLIVLLMYGTIGSSKQANLTLIKHTSQEHNRTMLFDLLYKDLWESISIKVTPTSDKHFTLLQLQTRNTLYDIAVPHVSYYVNAENKSLIRLEAAKEILLPIPYEENHAVHVNLLLNDVTDFSIYEHINKVAQNLSNTSASQKTDEQNSSVIHVPSDYLLYLNTAKLHSPLIIELSI